MGTNYYLYEQPSCPTCARPFDGLHIGKSSAGWCFALHVMPEDGINDLPDWEARWSKPGAEIRDEYDKVISADEMRTRITDRACPRSDNESAEWYRRNCAMPGPNNLARHRRDERCIRHGAGTWDCLVGEFS